MKQGLQRSAPASWSSRWQSCSHVSQLQQGVWVGEPEPALAAEVLGAQLDCHGVDRLQAVEKMGTARLVARSEQLSGGQHRHGGRGQLEEIALEHVHFLGQEGESLGHLPDARVEVYQKGRVHADIEGFVHEELGRDTVRGHIHGGACSG